MSVTRVFSKKDNGIKLINWLWGCQHNCSVNNATLNRFFALHFVLPFVLAALALMHLIALHDSAGSGNPVGVSGNYDRLPFAPYFIFKDLITIFLFILLLSIFVFFMPNILGDSENYVMANPMQTPPAIVPEWYLLPFYAILRSIPNKLVGVIAMFSAILILLAMPLTDLSRSRGIQFRPLSKVAFYVFIGNFLILMQLGAKHVESPFIEFGQISTVLYFAHFLIIVPFISLLENSLIELPELEQDDTVFSSYNYSYLTSRINLLSIIPVLSLFGYSQSKDYCDTPRPWGLYFQDSATPQMEGLVELHDNILFYLVIILFAVGWILFSIVRTYTNTLSPISHKYLNHGTLIELIWTITPALILILIAFPSFKLLYLMDEISDPAMSVLAEGYFLSGPKSYILNKIEDTYVVGKRNNIVKKIIFKRMFHTRIKAASRIGPHNLDVVSVIFGSLLGDCYASKRSIEGTRLCYRQSLVHSAYLFWLYNFFFTRGYCSNLNPRMYKRVLKNKDSGDKTHYGYEFNTYTFRSFNWIHKMFYKKGKKYINTDIVKYITPLALAIWISDDGGWAKPGVTIATNSFKLKQVEFLVEVLESKFALSCTIQILKPSGNYNIYIKGSSIPKLRVLILPFLHPSMYYKLGLKKQEIF